MVTMYVGKAIDDYSLRNYRVDGEYTTNHHGLVMGHESNQKLFLIHVPSTLHNVPRSHWWPAFDPWCLLKCKWRSFIFRNYTPFLTEGCSAYPYGGYYVFFFFK